MALRRRPVRRLPGSPPIRWLVRLDGCRSTRRPWPSSPGLNPPVVSLHARARKAQQITLGSTFIKGAPRASPNPSARANRDGEGVEGDGFPVGHRERKAPWRLLPTRIRIQVPRQLHGVMQHPTDNDQAGLNTIDKKAAWSVDHAHTGLRVFPAQSQVPRSNTGAKFGPRETAGPVGLGCDVAERSDDQILVTQSGFLAEAIMCPGEGFEHIVLCGLR
jgi:hypothetical protein